MEAPGHDEWWKGWSRGDRLTAGAVALLLALAPLATLAGAALLRPGVEADVARLGAEAAPRDLAEAEAARGRAMLRALLKRPTLAAVLDRLAAVLPEGDSVSRAGSDGEGRLEIAIATADPDRLRSALRREPLLAALRDAGQQQGEAALLVTLRSAR